MTLPSHVRHAPDVIFHEVSGELVLMHVETEHCFGLDAVGSRIWQLIAEDGAVQSVHEALAAQYEVDEPRLRRDLEQLLGQLLEAGLLTADAGAGPG
ncbi:PqqD family protein [Mangrovimicrobium sediminis]|nr:PqqD family protein [Haliea sp. SAOS-164]